MSKWSAAVSRASARTGYAIGVGSRPTTAHVVTVTLRECHDGVIRFDYRCSCGNALGNAFDTDGDARAAAKVHAPGVTFTTRALMPFVIVATNPRKAG